MNELNLTNDDGRTATLKPGDKCSFTRSRWNGSRGRISSREGVLVELGREVSSVKVRGKQEQVRTDSLRPAGWQNALTEGFLKAFNS